MLGLIVALLGSGGWIGTILGEKTPSIMTQVDNNGVLATPNPTAKPSPTEMHLPTPAPTLTLAQENFATPTLINRQAESARTFAEPILTAIGQHKPDFSDDFSKVKPAWKNYEDITKGGTFAIVEGVARFRINQGGTFTTNDNALTGKNYVFQVDARLVSGDTTSDITISFHNIGPSGRFSLYLFPATQDWDLRRYSRNSDESLTSGTGNAVSPVGKTTQITIIVRGSQGALYLNQTPQGFLEDEILNHVGKIMLFCNSVTPAVCEFDNIKFWNLENIANLP